LDCSDRPALTHQRFTKYRFDGTDQHGFGDPGRPADGIDAEMVAVDEIDIGMARFAEHDAIPGRQAAGAMAGRVIHQVGLRLNNGTAAEALGRAAKEPVTEQGGRYRPS
jgi:hypothetical protein